MLEELVSQELAVKLKSAGLKHIPESNDWFYKPQEDGIWEMIDVSKVDDSYVWIPRINQALDDFKKRGYAYRLESDTCESWIEVWSIDFNDTCKFKTDMLTGGRSDIEAVVEAWLWILEREREKNGRRII